jgi:hypothetical protein
MILNYTCKQTNYNVLLIPGECYSKLLKKNQSGQTIRKQELCAPGCPFKKIDAKGGQRSNVLP